MNNEVICRIKTLFESLIRNKKNLIKLMLVAVILLAALILRVHESSKEQLQVESARDNSLNEVIYVDLSGAVVSPGVYQVNATTRLYEVIEMAGGLTSNADIDAINRAEYVEDGEKILIPTKYVQQQPAEGNDEELIDDPSSTTSQTTGSSLININYATKEELKRLDGVGDAIADRIIEYRSAKKFKKKEDIKAVKGIGDVIFEKIKNLITV